MTSRPPPRPDDVLTADAPVRRGFSEATEANATVVVPSAEGAGGREAEALVPTYTRPWLEVVSTVGAGGMSEIHRVYHQVLRQASAMKSLRGELASSSRMRLIEEAQITGQLDHPNIPPVHDLWLDASGAPHFTMKLVHGQTLTRHLEALGDPKLRSDEQLADLLQVFIKVCDAISFAHSRGVVHRDLKPDNVMVGSHGQVYVVDWGCALLLAGPRTPDAVSIARDPELDSLDPPGAVVGTYSYMAPEQASAMTAAIDELTDVYLLGGVLYEILTGQAPHRGIHHADTIRRAIEGIVEEPQRVAGEVRLPPVLCAIAMRALRARPAERFPSVEALKTEIEHALRNGWWFTSISFPAGTLIVREGDEGDAAYIITQGTCEAFRDEDGERAVLRRMGPGEVFGETAIITSGKRTASVAALDEVTAIVVTREALEQEIGGSWLGVFVHALAGRFRELDAKLSETRREQRLSGVVRSL